MSCTEPNPMAAVAPPSPAAGASMSRRAGLALAAACVLAGCTSSAVRTSTSAPLPAGGVLARPSPSAAVRPAARNWDEYRLRAARQMVAANPQMTYTGEVPEPLLAIPVIEIELKADGSIARLRVLRHPSQADDTTELALNAIRRAAPFGDVTRLPKPWKFAEVFLFDDDRRFKPRTLDR